MDNNFELWEILVPTHDNNNNEFAVDKHKEWDAFVEKTTGGASIAKKIKGSWINEDKKTIRETMIPVRIACDEIHIEKIADFTARHYNQDAIMYYRLSNYVKIKNYPR